jgi:DNA-3-methyladenine glycosylase
MKILSKDFFQQNALKIAKDFLGKYLVYNSPMGRLSGMITEVEAYPAFLDNVSHGNKKTKRTKIMYEDGGHAYIYLIYGIHHQFAVVVNKKNIPEVVFIRAVIPIEGIEIMKRNFKREVKKVTDLTKSPGNLCKSFGITLDLYGEPIPGKKLWLENRNIRFPNSLINSDKRIGIRKTLKGSNSPYRYYVSTKKAKNFIGLFSN